MEYNKINYVITQFKVFKLLIQLFITGRTYPKKALVCLLTHKKAGCIKAGACNNIQDDVL